jgi:hypothetical protein
MLITPWRAQTNAEEVENLRASTILRFLNESTGFDYTEAMKAAGDPVQLALLLFPVGPMTATLGAGLGLLLRPGSESGAWNEDRQWQEEVAGVLDAGNNRCATAPPYLGGPPLPP